MAKKTPAKRTPSNTGASSLPPEQREEAPVESARQTSPPPPVCPYHKQPCAANRSEPLFTRYYCTVKGCTFSQKVPRPDLQQRLLRDRRREEDFSAR